MNKRKKLSVPAIQRTDIFLTIFIEFIKIDILGFFCLIQYHFFYIKQLQFLI